MPKQQFFEIEVFQVKYTAGAPPDLGRWYWRCTCEDCRASGRLFNGGPFQTRRAAERDAENACALVVVEPSGSS